MSKGLVCSVLQLPASCQAKFTFPVAGDLDHLTSLGLCCLCCHCLLLTLYLEVNWSIQLVSEFLAIRVSSIFSSSRADVFLSKKRLCAIRWDQGEYYFRGSTYVRSISKRLTTENYWLYILNVHPTHMRKCEKGILPAFNQIGVEMFLAKVDHWMISCGKPKYWLELQRPPVISIDWCKVVRIAFLFSSWPSNKINCVEYYL